VLFFVSLERRRIEFVASTSNPDGRWVAQQARNLLMLLADREHSFRFVLHDRDSKFSRAFDELFRSEDMKIIRTPIRAPNANAYAERWVGTVRRECLDRILIINRRLSVPRTPFSGFPRVRRGHFMFHARARVSGRAQFGKSVWARRARG
jgi:putative transposase